MGIGQAKPSAANLKLVDRSLVHLEKRIDDVLIQVDKFVFHADFIILDFETYENVPILLERPFLATWRTLIDVYKGNLILRTICMQLYQRFLNFQGTSVWFLQAFTTNIESDSNQSWVQLCWLAISMALMVADNSTK